ncbi:hypothetical protein FOCG_10292 [Fusarium oxysporum f. sp. radicis-lycopersici 26381]|uniref:3-hydroxyisobutyrate dehydrogenase n=1 Tax=Fusarium oxysporum TaxID=5507 RepID=A0A8H5E0J8_FUSOX|nr:hypothetical protein FOCG_10292 [Fusarium oxysporum f. sp. radicis-lycopersici 26381]KAF5242690.1 hypothetical protein FOXYS1_15350 [Fusarium oxysporum]
MGYPMAVNLVKGLGSSKSFLTVNVNQEALNEFQDEVKGFGKVSVVQNVYEATKAAYIVITILPTVTAVEAVYLDPNTGILAGAIAATTYSSPTNKLLIECGTIETAIIKKLAEAVEEASLKMSNTLSFVDAPVSSSPMGAIAGSLTFIVGVHQANVITSVAAAEALNIGVKAGLDLKLLLDVINGDAEFAEFE